MHKRKQSETKIEPCDASSIEPRVLAAAAAAACTTTTPAEAATAAAATHSPERELAALALTAVWFGVTDIYGQKLVFIVTAVAAWSWYFYTIATGPHGRTRLRQLGLTPSPEETRVTLKWNGLVATLTLAAILIWGWWDASSSTIVIIDQENTRVIVIDQENTRAMAARGWFVNWNLAWLILVYPFWGCVQQLLVLGFGARNIALIIVQRRWRVNPEDANHKTTVVVGTLFGILHALAEPALIVACLGLGFVWVGVFLRYSCLWPLGAFHGLLGAFFYFFVLRRDPLAELF